MINSNVKCPHCAKTVAVVGGKIKSHQIPTKAMPGFATCKGSGATLASPDLTPAPPAKPITVTFVHTTDTGTYPESREVSSFAELVALRAEHIDDTSFKFDPPLDVQVRNAAMAVAPFAAAHTPVRSSNVQSFAYDPASRILEVAFKGGAKYRYADVPAEVAAKMLAVESVGKFLSEHVKGVYATTKVNG